MNRFPHFAALPTLLLALFATAGHAAESLHESLTGLAQES